MRINKPVHARVRTHEGAPAHPASLKPENALRRAVLSCLLWEDQFYEDGMAIADRITQTAMRCAPEFVADLAIEARSVHNLRHVPLLLLEVLSVTGAGRPGFVAGIVERVIQRPDELTELLALHWKDNPDRPIPAQFKKGLARAARKFDAYQLAKYNRADAVKLRDVIFLTHPKPSTLEQAMVWARLVNKNRFPGTTKGGFTHAFFEEEFKPLDSPDTWEVALSAGKDKKATFERLLAEDRLGYLALLRNLRNMEKAGVDSKLVEDAIRARKGAQRVLPFRYIAAAKAAPQFEPALDVALQAAIKAMPKLRGETIVLVDVSGSMSHKLSDRADMTRMDAAAALGAVINCESKRVFTFSDRHVEVPPRSGLAGVDAIIDSQRHSGTLLGESVDAVNRMKGPHDRLIVITDEQSHTYVPEPQFERAYMINVASYKNGIGYGKWTHLDGFSEGIIRYITAIELEGEVVGDKGAAHEGSAA